MHVLKRLVAKLHAVFRQKLLANAEKRKKAISDTPFKGPSPMKLSVGLGDFHGTFQGNVPYIAVGDFSTLGQPSS